MAAITILGAGVMGSAMCLPAADNGHDVRLVGTHLDEGIIDSVKQSGKHPKLGVTLPENVRPFQHRRFAEALGLDSDLLVLGISSAGVNWAIEQLCETLKKPVPVVMITKGMQPFSSSLQTLPDFVRHQVNTRTGMSLQIAAIGGPCIAGELAVRRQTGTVITSRDGAFAQLLCELLRGEYYHPRPSTDLLGVEVCAAFKNFFAIAVGWAAGRHEAQASTENKAFNYNAASILFSQAVKELAVLTAAFGGDVQSAYGMPGAGDLYVTCLAGRNSRLGNNLGRGLTYQQAVDGPMKGDTIEGAELGRATAPSLRAMISKQSLDLPLTEALLETLVNNTPLNPDWARFHRVG